MTHKSNSIMRMLSTLPIAGFVLCSCAVQNPEYAANASNITNVDYPPDQIVGTWAHVMSSSPQASTRGDTKMYYEMRSGGKGTTLQYSLFRSSGHSVAMEAPITWKYLGGNQWIISIPPSTSYRIIENQGVNTGYSEARNYTARYYNDKLYCTAHKGNLHVGFLMVRATEENVAETAKRARSEHPVIDLGGGLIRIHRE